MRSDIQFLRGVAVLLVVACHAFPRWLPFGYLGVDVFFVISGFLMTKMIVTGLDRGDFTFRGFYLRRARRLLPASFSTIAATFALAWFFLPNEAWHSFWWQVIGALTFTANLVSQVQIGGVHAYQPLSHFWSLSLEEQFYLFFPLLLWITPKRFRVWGIAVIAVESIALQLLGGKTYLLPPRAWELLFGSLAYFATFPMPRWARWFALATMPLVAIVGSTALAVIATSAMLIGKDDWVKFPPVEKIGDWSYSLYLVHWPLISFAAVYWSNSPVAIASAFVLSFVLAALQYRYVELRWRGRAKVVDENGPRIGRVLIRSEPVVGHGGNVG